MIQFLKTSLITITFSLISFTVSGQSDSLVYKELPAGRVITCEPVVQLHTYPEIKGYTGLVHPIFTMTREGNVVNFKDYYLVGNPWGINIWKSKRVGLSFEFTSFIRTTKNESKLSNFLFHPGILYRLKNDWILIGRVAYETSGRYGFTPILNKVVKRGKHTNFFMAVLLPTRFGNKHAPAVTGAFQFGVGF